MRFKLDSVPFSYYGAYISLGIYGKNQNLKKGLYIRTMHGDVPAREVYRVEVLANGKEVPFTAEGTPEALVLKSKTGKVEICFQDAKTLRIRCFNSGVRLLACNVSQVIKREGTIEVNSRRSFIKFAATCISGKIKLSPDDSLMNVKDVFIDLLPENKTGELVLEEFMTTYIAKKEHPSFDSCRKKALREFEAWSKLLPETPKKYEKGSDLAAYILWSCAVAPLGHLKRWGLYMSKNWMLRIWSWDNCFNAMALAYKNQELAWDQFMIPFDYQDEFGALPDAYNDQYFVWNYCKPPVQGVVLRWMMENTSIVTKERLKEIYSPLGRWTDWWLLHRDYDKDGVPQYNHGNDSGWDNATVFDAGIPLEGPDLSAFLIIQMDMLAGIAKTLGKSAEEKEWKKKADTLLEKLIEHSWTEKGFVSRRSGDHTFNAKSESLVNFIPLILGERLPEAYRKTLLDGIKKSGLLTKNGPATEAIKSPLYIADGYWRGPVWAPSTMIIVEGLKLCGEKKIAKELAGNYCRMCNRYGMAENFDAKTGKGLRDLAFAWTSSVFLILAKEYK